MYAEKKAELESEREREESGKVRMYIYYAIGLFMQQYSNGIRDKNTKHTNHNCKCTILTENQFKYTKTT